MASGVSNEAKTKTLGPQAQAYFDELKQLEKEHLEELTRLKQQQWDKVKEKQDLVDSLFSDELYNTLDSNKLQYENKDFIYSERLEPHTSKSESIQAKQQKFRYQSDDQVQFIIYPERKDLNFEQELNDIVEESDVVEEPQRLNQFRVEKDNAEHEPSEIGDILKEITTNVQIAKRNQKFAAAQANQTDGDKQPLLECNSSVFPKEVCNSEFSNTDKTAVVDAASTSNLSKVKNKVEEQKKKLGMESHKEKENNMNSNNTAPKPRQPFLKKGAGLKRFAPKPISRVKTCKPKEQDKGGTVLQMTANSKETPCHPVVVKHFVGSRKNNSPLDMFPTSENENISSYATSPKRIICHSAGDIQSRQRPVFEKNEQFSQESNFVGGDFFSNARITVNESKSKKQSQSSNADDGDFFARVTAESKSEKASQMSLPIVHQDLSAKETAVINKEKNQKQSQSSDAADGDFFARVTAEHKSEKASQMSLSIVHQDLSAKATAVINKEKNLKSNVFFAPNEADENSTQMYAPFFLSERNNKIQAIIDQNQLEAKELIQYEILEDIAHTSINSDSSLIMDVVHAEETSDKATKEPLQRHNINSTKPPTKSSDDPDFAQFASYRAELEHRRKLLEKQMKQCDEKLTQFQTTDVASLLANVSSDDELSSPKQDSSSCATIHLEQDKVKPNKSQSLHTKSNGGVSKSQEASCSTITLESEETVPISSSVTLLKEKLQELNEEIETYKAQNALIEKLKAMHENELKKLEKDREDFTTFKANEITKLENEIKEKKSQIMKEKQTFEKYQKLKRELPGKKEKEEYDSLKKKFEALQDEMKKKSIKFNAEIKRLRQLLDANEKELNSAKAENQILISRLENMKTENVKQVSGAKMSKKISKRKDGVPKLLQDDVESKTSSESYPSDDGDYLKSEYFPLKKDVFQSLTSPADMESIPDVDDIHRVRFNLDPEVKTFSKDDSMDDYKEITSSSSIERIFNDGHKEILYFNGSRKHVSSDGKYCKTKYFNGDTEEVFPDKHSVYTFATGYKQTFFPDGLKVYENPGQFVEKRFPNGVRQVVFNDNTVVIRRPDGSVEKQNPNGGARVVFVDGTEVIRYPSGEVEVRTSDYIRHEFADGTVKTVYRNGKCETSYSNGRLRIKDREGNVIFDDVVR